jgi:hypothetical protein
MSKRSSVLDGALRRVTRRQDYIPPPAYPTDDARTFAARIEAQANAEMKARSVIYAAVSRWAGVPAEPGGKIPVIRNGQIVEWRGTLLSDPIAPILRAARLAPVSSLKTEKGQLEKLLDAMESVRRGMEELDREFGLTLHGTWDSWERGAGEPVDIVHALGIRKALNVSLHGMMLNIRQRLSDIDEELRLQSSRKGRPPLRPAYETAREFALLYATVTGKRPTCSVSDSMVSGEFAPALRDLFDVFGWTDIRGPGNAAVEAITDEQLHTCKTPEKGLFGGLFGLGQ